jgi:translation elongation factor EF-1alpha
VDARTLLVIGRVMRGLVHSRSSINMIPRPQIPGDEHPHIGDVSSLQYNHQTLGIAVAGEIIGMKLNLSSAFPSISKLRSKLTLSISRLWPND